MNKYQPEPQLDSNVMSLQRGKNAERKQAFPRPQETSEVMSPSPQSESEGSAVAGPRRQELTGQEC